MDLFKRAVLIIAFTGRYDIFASDYSFYKCHSSYTESYTCDLVLNAESISIQNIPGKLLTIDCQKNHVNYTRLKLSRLQTHTDKFRLSRCYVPDMTLKDILSGQNTTVTKYVHLKEISDRNVTKHHMKGLKDVSNITLEGSKYSEDIFDGMKNLTFLEIVGKELYFTKKLFKPLENLKILIIKNYGQNNTKFQDDVFMPLISLEKLYLGNLYILPELVNYTLKNLKTLEIYKCPLTSLPSDLVADSRNIRKITIQYSGNLASLPNQFLSELKKLKVVKITRCGLQYLASDLFLNLKNLECIDLSNNKIGNLTKNLFQNQIKVIRLDLSKNKIDNLPENLFSVMTKLETLNLACNQIKEMPSSIFSNLTNLQSLNMSNNLVKYIDPYVFGSVSMLINIDMAHNHLNFNNTTSFFPQNVQYVNLSNNYVSSLCYEWRDSSVQLKYLNLYNNSIRALTFEDVSFVSNNLTIDLRANNITDVDFSNTLEQNRSFKSQKDRVKVLIDSQHLDCRCHFFYVIKYMEVKDSRLQIEMKNAACAVKGLEINNSITFVCPYEEQCPTNCSCSVRMSDRNSIVNCFNNSKVPVLPHFPLINVKRTKYHINGETELRMERGNLTKIMIPQVSKLFLSGNMIKTVETEGTNTKVKVLDLSNNSIEHISGAVMKILFTSGLEELQLIGNPLACYCENWDFIHSLQKFSSVVLNYTELECPDTTKFTALSQEYLCNNTKSRIVIISVTIVFITMLIVIAVLAIYKYNQEIIEYLYVKGIIKYVPCITENDSDDDKIYDAFVSFSFKDIDFVMDEMVVQLENDPFSFSLCLHYRDWVIAKNIPLQIDNSVRNSRKTIILLTPSFLQSNWCLMEFHKAYEEALKDKRYRIIVIMKGSVSIEDLEPELKTFTSNTTYIQWGDPLFWIRLRSALSHRGYHLSWK